MKRFWHIVTVVAAAAGMISCAATSRTAFRDRLPSGYEDGYAPYYYHTEGIKAYAVQGDTARGIDLFRRALEIDSAYAPASYELAELLMAGGDLEAATGFSRNAMRLDTANLTYRSQLGRVLVLSGRYDEAMDIYTRLMREDSHNPMNYKLLAALYEFDRQPYSALSILDTAEMRLGRMEEISAYKRELSLRLRLYDKAIEETEKLIADYPYDDDNYRVLGDIYVAMGRDSLAEANYREAFRLDSTNINTLAAMADYYLGRNDAPAYLRMLQRIFASDDMPFAKKRDVFGQLTSDVPFYRDNYFAINTLAGILIAKYPDDYEAVDLYATHLIRGGEVEQGLSFYKAYLALHPDRIEPYDEVVWIEAYLQRPDSVAKYSDMGLRRFLGNTDLLVSKAYAYIAEEDFDRASKVFRTACRTAANDSVRSALVGTLGDIAYQTGRTHRCYRYYRRALRLDPDNAGVLNNYAYYLGEEGRELERALAMSRRANELVPRNASSLDTEGWILYLMGRYEEARKVMQLAVSYDGNNSAVLLFHYAEVLYAMGDTFLASVYWERALNRGYDPETIRKRMEMIEEK